MFLSIALPCTMVFIPPSSPWISHDDDDDDVDDDKVLPRSSNLDGKSLNGVCDEKKTLPKDDTANRRCLLEDRGTRDESHPTFAMATPDRNASEVKYIPLDGDGKECLSLMELEQGAAGEEGGIPRTRVQCGDWLRLLSYPDVFLLGIGILLGSVCLSFLYFSTVSPRSSSLIIIYPAISTRPTGDRKQTERKIMFHRSGRFEVGLEVGLISLY